MSHWPYRPITPLEQSIDRACGFERGAALVPITIRIECPKCEKSQECVADETDPEGTAKVVVMCPECNAGDFDTPTYFDASGKELFWQD